jgi:hypothetical protein
MTLSKAVHFAFADKGILQNVGLLIVILTNAGLKSLADCQQ